MTIKNFQALYIVFLLTVIEADDMAPRISPSKVAFIRDMIESKSFEVGKYGGCGLGRR
jgi:hypothetical protein